MKGIKQKMVLSAAVLGAVIFFYLLRFVLASPGVPQIDFVSPTDASGSNVPRNYTYINISVVNDTQVTAVGVEWDGVNVTLFNRSGLIGLWHFSENSIASGGVKDSSGNDYHATASGATFTNNGKFDSAWSFDGVDDIVDTGSSTIFNNLKSLTIEMWINRSGGELS